MTDYPRYAIYYAPPSGSGLDRFGTQMIGYDAFGGRDMPFPEAVLMDVPDWRDLTSDPRKYGFHATLKAPLSLPPDRTEAELVAACAAFANIPREIPLIKPVLDSISGFIAVVPRQPPDQLVRLAADCVSEFDAFRAPLTSEDRERRNPAGLSQRQREHLDRWGYPYVMEDFRFHMTLTGRLAAERRESVLSMLRDRFSGLDLDALAIDSIALFRQPNAGSRFRIVGYWQLRANDA